ncbi:hypothetical protein B0F90DRAFT_1668891 [Multifurca ochricompacta]|uniref:Uncharacterized protein n=1 Tax=Multifurca ochricompacta TaxID=376703 RepID=A0AAD4M2D0_9AGAM|nr:hypothetical protein B0F90DRAFT_1668891 [Multifurca ochricompacta]
MATCYIHITSPSQSTTSVHIRNTCSEDAGLLASLAYGSAIHRGSGSKPPVGDVLTALQHPGRVHELTLDLTSTMVEGLATQMQEPLPALECLSLKSQDKAGSVVLPTVFLGGSAPRLRDIHLCGIAFSTLPKLLLSARDLVSLRLEKIPRTGYFPPEVLACSLSEMTELTSLHIQFLAPTSRPSQKSRRPPPLTLIVLHSLTEFKFRGISEYLEDILARINAPLLRNLEVTFFNQLIFEIPHLSQFIGRTETSQSLNQAMVYSSRSGISLILTKVRQPAGNNPVNRRFALQISCGQLDWQVSSVSQICTYFSPLLSRVERLYIRASPRSTGWPDDIEPSQWLELLDSYGSVKRLHVIGPLGPNVAPALQQVTRRMMDPPEVLPALRRLHLGGNSKSAPVDAFIARRQLCGHNITRWTPSSDAVNLWRLWMPQINWSFNALERLHLIGDAEAMDLTRT